MDLQLSQIFLFQIMQHRIPIGKKKIAQHNPGRVKVSTIDPFWNQLNHLLEGNLKFTRVIRNLACFLAFLVN